MTISAPMTIVRTFVPGSIIKGSLKPIYSSISISSSLHLLQRSGSTQWQGNPWASMHCRQSSSVQPQRRHFRVMWSPPHAAFHVKECRYRLFWCCLTEGLEQVRVVLGIHCFFTSGIFRHRSPSFREPFLYRVGRGRYYIKISGLERIDQGKMVG